MTLLLQNPVPAHPTVAAEVVERARDSPQGDVEKGMGPCAQLSIDHGADVNALKEDC